MQTSLAGRLALRIRLVRHVICIRAAPRMQACRAAHGTRKCSSMPTTNSLERQISPFSSLMSVSRISCIPALSSRRMFAISAEGEADTPAAAASGDAATTDEPAAAVTDAPPTAEDAPVEPTKEATMAAQDSNLAAQESAPAETAPRTAMSPDEKLGLARQRAEASRQEGRRIFVANMSYNTTWMGLKDHFKRIGHVSYASIKMDGRGVDARSKGCGIVEFESASDAERAIKELHDSQLDGRSLLVREDQGSGPPRQGGYEDRPGGSRAFAPRGGGDSGGRGGGSSGGAKIVVHGLPYRVTWQDLKDIGNQASDGECMRADVVMDRNSGRSRGFGFMTFTTTEAADVAISAIQGSEMDGRYLTAKHDEFVNSRPPPRS